MSKMNDGGMKVTFEERDTKLENIKAGKKITIWMKKKKTQTDNSEFRIISGKVIKIYPDFVQVFVGKKKSGFMECFLKQDLCKSENDYSVH